MPSDRKIARQILYIIKGLKPGKIKLSDIEIIYINGSAVGCRVEFTSEKKPELKVIPGEKKVKP